MHGSLRKDDEERDNIRRYISQKYPMAVEKYKKDHLKTKSSKAVETGESKQRNGNRGRS